MTCLAEATGWSASTLRNGASGQRPPRQDVLPWGRDQTDGPCPPAKPTNLRTSARCACAVVPLPTAPEEGAGSIGGGGTVLGVV